MSFTRVLAFLMFIFCYSLALSQAQMPAPATAKSADTPAAQTSPAAPIHVPPPSEPPSGDEKSYRAEIRQLMNAGNFDQLDHTADLARSNKSRFPGGVWKLYIFYDELSTPVGDEQASEAEWNSHLDTLHRWISHNPQSITPRLAVSEFYLKFAWRARGHEYADSVSKNELSLFDYRTGLARSTLENASFFKAKCPYWYQVMLEVALAQGWEKPQTEALLEQAIAFEPGFYHYYRSFNNFLLPKWYGEEGEAEAFVDKISTRLGGKEGAFVYFELATQLNCRCGKATLSTMSWERIKQGYVALEDLYGTSQVKLNRYAYMTVLAKDRMAAQQAFARLGNNWDPDTWGRRATFEASQTWALGR